jgi:NAD-dependent DNA ligase
MPSLDKIKPGQDTLRRFLAAPAASAAGFVLSEKLDGLSALWLPAAKKLYLRGDGITGQDVSHLVGLGLGGLVQKGGPTVAVRGEILLPRSAGEPLARAWVNGVIHRKDPAAADVAMLRFVAYEVLSPKGMRRAQQFPWLAQTGYEVPWWLERGPGEVSEATLADALQARRRDAPYDTDGIVVGWNLPPQSESTTTRARNPKDCVAFKMPLADQSAETTVREVLWATSGQGYIIPRLRFDPVTIGAATIEFCTGHNARAIVDGRVGPGARVIIRRSGDVIPKLDAVLVPAQAAALPPLEREDGSVAWEWACPEGSDPATAVHIRAIGAETAEQTATRLHHFLKTLDVPGAGPSTAKSLVEGGIKGPRALWDATAARLSELLGPKTGASLYTNLRTALEKATEMHLMLASLKMPRGVGDTKLRVLFTVEGDPKKWLSAAANGATNAAALSGKELPGWSATALETFLAEFPKYEAWRAAELPFLPYPAVPLPGSGAATTAAAKREGAVLAAASAASKAAGQTVCFTGFRDKQLEAQAAELGHTVAVSMTSKVNVLVVPDGEVRESEKVKAARAKGITIMTRAVFVDAFLK